MVSIFGEFLYQELIKVNIYKYKLENQFDSSIFENNNIQFVDNDNGFYFSRVAFNKDMDYAILYFADARIDIAGIGYIIALINNNGYWEIKEMLRIWIS